jgi:hypothetical protein
MQGDLVTNKVRHLQLSTILIFLSACATTGGQSKAPRQAPDLLTRAEITASSATNAYELISRLRPNWLKATGTSHISGGTTRSQVVLVYLDGQRLEDLRALRTISANTIQSAQWLDASRAPVVLRDVPNEPIAGAIVLKTQ